MKPSSPAQSTNRGRWIPWAFVGAFAVVAAANGIFVWLAFDSFPGLETEGAYEKGLAYDSTLVAAGKQRELGWQASISHETAISAAGGLDLTLTVALSDRAGAPIAGLAVRALLWRPTAEGFDVPADLHEMAPGRYVAALTLPLPGQWDVRLIADGSGTSWQTSQRLILH
jgi:nitrogen fixation protein FixH